MGTCYEAEYRYVAMPCRNFNILGHTSVVDPQDGKEKYVLSNFALGGTGTIILIDALTGEGESFELPVGNGAWGIVNWHDEKLVIGTCVEQAYLHVFDLKSRTWAEPLKSFGEEYFWQMTLGSDDKVYGGTYPGCSLMQYDPATHTLKNLGKVSGNEKNLYSRPVWGEAPGYIFVSFGFDTNGLKAYRIEDGIFSDFGEPGATIKEINEQFICTEANGVMAFYHPQTLEPLEAGGLEGRLSPKEVLLRNGQNVSVIKLKSGKLAGFRGQDYFIADAPAAESDCEKPIDIELRKIPAEAPVTEIFALVPDGRGQIWGASGFGQTIFSCNPENGQYWNSSSVSNHGGEVYGMVFVGERLFMSAYAGGDHIVYDPAEEWDQVNNVNPQTLRSVKPDLIRPEGRSVIGPDGAIWTGWSAKYGTYRGGLSRLDPETMEVESWYDPIPEQQVAGVAADGEYVYFTTNGGASGLAFRKDIGCRFGIWKPGEGLVHQVELPEGEQTGYGIAAGNGIVALAVGKEIRLFDVAAKSFGHTIPTQTECNWIVKLDDRKIGAFCGKELLEIDVMTGEASLIAGLPGKIRCATVTESGDIYFSVQTSLYALHKK
ncbi:hypothetical protein [Paenibacillus contaminans]|uniref:WD40 repeat domain-containing protein n=1 Tax=Paenibacillus contaminans TaxID=450362 RepID=A0A329MMB4_9BACL|nr:hypothetical protein [Paenibacillus contaminans]RAV20904.1 hypothetical protein DQG23_12495 [Paenibacillus contaminans]